MKIRFTAVTCFGLLGCLLPAARGFQTPEQPALPNYDVRAATKAAPPDAREDQAAASLKSRVPAAQIARDNLLGSPKLISASRGFLTGPNGKGKAVTPAQIDALPANDPHRAIKAFVNEHAALFGHDAKTLSAATVTRDYVTEHNGMRTVVWQQTVDNIPVFEGVFMGHLTSKGELVSVASRFVPEPDKAAANGGPNRRALVANPTLSAARAVALAARNLGADLEESSVSSTEGLQGPDKHQSYSAALLRGEAQVELRWLPVNRDSMRLCWRVELTVRTRPELYSVLLDVETGEVLVRRCLTEYIKPATYNVYTSDSPTPFSPGSAAASAFQPAVVPRQLVTLTALSTNASPNGWINDADNETRGNNVDAHTDKNGDDVADVPRPQGVGPARVFNYPLDLALPPGSYSDAAVVSLFYWNNFMHDKLYELGFTEAAGNFQNNNFNRGGRGNDAVQADAQDGSGFNNANFSSPADGSPGRMQMFLFDGPNPDRDGDLDAEVMCHEYGHGVSSRLVGGGAGISALQTRGMGEGWSDFYALSLLSEANDDVNGNYASGGYASYQIDSGFDQNYYFGIRRYPYSTVLSKNPLTFKDIDPAKASLHPGIPVAFQGAASEVHNQGEVWCVTLWEARVALVEKWGFTVGNQLILRLVTDGMKLSPQNPTFLEARDAIIRADEVGGGGENYNELWIAFAKRGMGVSAKCPPSETTIGVSEAYDVPPDVAVSQPDGILEVTLNPPANSALFAGSTQAVFLRITDAGPVTNATISATINGTSLDFRNDGVAPDATAGNSIYSAAFIVPTGVASVTLTFNITAPGKDPSTGAVNYAVIGIPVNDNFTNAIKVPPNGAIYVSNNKLATLETNEPTHAGISTASASLWWSFAPTNNGPVLVDTAGSTFNSIVAVYTNATLATLGEVASADDFGTRDQAFVVFNGRAGITYRIAVASAVPSSTGTVYLNIAPNGMADTNPPVVTVTSPMSGLTVATNRVLVTGTAVDPEPVPSGINDVSIRVSSSGVIGTTHAVTDSLIVSSNWSRQVGLSEGLNVIQVSATDFAGNKSATVTVQVNYVPNDPVNDLFANALSLTAVPEVSSVSTTRATKEFNEPAHAGNAGGKSVWWWFQAPDDGVLSLSTTNSSFDTLLAVYTGSAVSALTLLADNDDAGAGGFSALTLAVRSNQTYRIAVDGFDGASGVVFLHYAFTPATVYNLTINTTPGGHVTPSSGPAASDSTVILKATPDEFFQFDNWTGSIFSRANPLSVIVQSNLDLTAHFSPILFTDDFETGNLLKLGWTTSGDAPWIVQTNTVLTGSFSAKSGAIGNSQSSSLRFTTNFAGGAGSFYFKVSSEPGWDFLQFYVDDSLVQQWSGEVGWQNYPFSLSNGTHTLEWRYTKDAELAAGQDAAFLDNVNLPINPSMDAATPAYLQILRQTDGSLLLQIHGETNREYVVQGATDLTPPAGWQDLATNVATGGVIQYVDPSTGTNLLRFYRAVAR